MKVNGPIVERLRFAGSGTRNPFDIFRQVGKNACVTFLSCHTLSPGFVGCQCELGAGVVIFIYLRRSKFVLLSQLVANCKSGCLCFFEFSRKVKTSKFTSE